MSVHQEMVAREINFLSAENKRLRKALEEIREIAQVSKGASFWEMLADKALKHED